MADWGVSFRNYCQSTSLHGWQYIYRSRSHWRIFWFLMVLTSVVVAVFVVFMQGVEFHKATVVTTVDTTTAPLSDVYFPSVTICNINQVRRSFLQELEVHNNWSVVDMLFREFYTGSDRDLAADERAALEKIFKTKFYVQKEIEYNFVSTQGSVNQSTLDGWEGYLEQFRDYIIKGTHFSNFAVQEPGGVMILKASYGSVSRPGNSTDFNPYFGTDVGICSIIKPQLSFNESLAHLPFWAKLSLVKENVHMGSEVGKANGLNMLLDAETFDYTYHLKAGQGFKLSVHHHLDQPIMSIKEIDISVGKENQVAVATTLTSTTAEARSRFSPLERGCYFEGELQLKYLPGEFYRYEMSNCLFEGAYEVILEHCNCTPGFHLTGFAEYPWICTGTRLKCMSKILHRIGNYNNISRGDGSGIKDVPCLAACEDQLNLVTETSSAFPNTETFHRREEFCLLAKKLIRTCATKKAVALGDHFPSLCAHLAEIQDPERICSSGFWDPPTDHPNLLRPLTEAEKSAFKFRDFQTSPNPKTLSDLIREELFVYAKRNLALVNVYIRDPVVTRIKRDEKIPLIGFVANTGGLLGLTMGFSLVSVLEVIYHLLVGFFTGFNRSVHHVRSMKRKMRRKSRGNPELVMCGNHFGPPTQQQLGAGDEEDVSRMQVGNGDDGVTEGQEDESGEDDNDEDEEEDTLTTAHVNNHSFSESTNATVPATTPLLPNGDARSILAPLATPDDKPVNGQSSLTVCSEEVAVAASAHSGNCSTLRNRSNGKAGSAKNSQLEGSWIWRGKCSGHISNGGVQSTSAPLATPDDTPVIGKSSLTVCSEEMAEAESAHSANCSTLRNPSEGKAGSAKGSQNEESGIGRGNCSGHMSNGGVTVGAELLRTKLLRNEVRKSEEGDGKVLNSICAFCNVEHQV